MQQVNKRWGTAKVDADDGDGGDGNKVGGGGGGGGAEKAPLVGQDGVSFFSENKNSQGILVGDSGLSGLIISI